MKIAVSGKGGVGKTTLSAGLARHWATQGRRVVAVDADPDANLAMALGATREQEAACTPLSQQDDLIEERTGARPGAGGMFRMNPDVGDVVDSCGVDVEGVTLLRLGTIERGGAGCMCSEGVFLQAFMHELIVRREDVAVLDMEAGIEHLGRGTAQSVDAFVVVVEPTTRSVQTAHAVQQLAADIGVRDVVAVGNKIQDEEDIAYLRRELGDVPLLATIPQSEAVRRADRDGRSPFDADPDFAKAIDSVAARLTEHVMSTTD